MRVMCLCIKVFLLSYRDLRQFIKLNDLVGLNHENKHLLKLDGV